MSEEFQGGVCGGRSSWWINPSTNLFCSSPCASAINGPGSLGWLSHDQPMIHLKTTRSGSYDLSGSAVSGGSGCVVLIDDGSNWNPNLLLDNNNNIGKSNQNYSNHMLQQANSGIDSSMNINNCHEQNSFHHLFNSYNKSSLLQTLFDADSQPNHLRQPLSDNSNNNQSTTYLNPAGFCPSFSKLDSKTDSNHLQFNINTTPSPSFLPWSQPQSLLQSKPNLNGLHTKKNNQESKKVSDEPSLKRPRVETSSPLPTFKVRKEKMGDRITALQQLVSPFGKTDTASVLHEAIEYIKFLHDQVDILTTPYLKKNGSTQMQHQQNIVKGETHDLHSRGLCLVPISSTFPVAAETATDFWAPNFGGCFR